MAENYLTLSREERLDALGVAATESGRPVHLLEKDIWVVWAIDGLFSSDFGKHLVFKGGTSLSKAYDVKCPGGCGTVLEINLVPDMRPRWKVTEDKDGVVTIEPSIWRKKDCECHFRITRGIIRWY